jgi:hypothetical protein
LNGDLCYGSVKMIRFNSSNEDTKDEEPKRSTVRMRNGQNP